MMKASFSVLFGALLLVAPRVLAADPAIDSAGVADSSEADFRFVIETKHRLHPNFIQVDTVGLDEPFYIGEDEYEARVILFNPHLGITQTGDVLTMSDTLYNPAVRVQVTIDEEVSQESWGFYYVDAPHFAREDLLGFKLREFEVGDRYVKRPERK